MKNHPVPAPRPRAQTAIAWIRSALTACIFPACTLTALILLTLSCGKKEAMRPNILLIVADDLGWKDVGFMGSEYYETPNLDRLAFEGLVFKQGYAAAANCAPSRACLMSGRNTPVHGVYTVGSPARGDERTRRIIPAENRSDLDLDFYTLAEALKDAGYVTCQIGKWHLGEDPCEQGFELSVAGSHWGHPQSYFAPYIRPELDAPEGEYLTDRLTSEAIHFVQRDRDQPFFLYLPYYAVHTPIQPKPGDQARYESKGPRGCQGRADYAGMVDNLDRNIGLLLEALKTQELEENTLVIFTSDNGGIRSISCQDPLRAGKGSYYEGGIRVPLVFSWPGMITAGTSHEVAVNLDFYPTIVDLLDLESEGQAFDGTSLWPLLIQGEALPERSLFWHFPIYLQAYNPLEDDGRDPLFRTRPGSVIRKGPWKLHLYYEDGGVELYNLEDDPGERLNKSVSNSQKTKELLGELEVWLEGQGAPRNFPPNPAYDSLVEAQLVHELYVKEAVRH